jgi:hypothetical protein
VTFADFRETAVLEILAVTIGGPLLLGLAILLLQRHLRRRGR